MLKVDDHDATLRYSVFGIPYSLANAEVLNTRYGIRRSPVDQFHTSIATLTLASVSPVDAVVLLFTVK